jgi:hypothetical protein
MVLHEKLRTLPVRNRFLQSAIDKSVLGKYIANWHINLESLV